MIEIPPKFAGQSPIGPIPKGDKQQNLLEDWEGAKGLAEDVRRYGNWMHEEAVKRIGHLYPKVKITDDMVAKRPDLEQYRSDELTVIAWLWARTVKSPNPAFSHIDVPLARSFVLSSKKGKEFWVKTITEKDSYHFEVNTGKIPNGELDGTVARSGGTCILSKTPIPFKYIREQAKNNKMNMKLMAIVAEGKKGRVYISPTSEIEEKALAINGERFVETTISHWPGRTNVVEYGMTKFLDIFTSRQLVALTTFSDLINEAREKAIQDAKAVGMYDDGLRVSEEGKGATAYGDALAVFLTFIVDRSADFNNSLTGWRKGNEKIMYLFSRQAIPMVWDFGEANIVENVVGGFITNLEYQVKCLLSTFQSSIVSGHALQQDASNTDVSINKVISSDPPYYDNIGYADLSDFFYIWMRRSLRTIYPTLFSTMAVPKAEELVATPYRHGNKEKAETFFLDGMTKAISNMAEKAHPAFPVTIYYAFKQSETKEESTSSTGWETFLEAVIRAGFSIDGTWPIRSEQSSRIIGMGSNALASSVVLVCKKRKIEAESISRREFQRELRDKIPEALEAMIGGETGTTPIIPVDLAQAAIGPGMAIYSKYADVLNQDGSKLTVHEALILINRSITDYLNPDSGNFDADTLFCDNWFSQYGWGEGSFGEADTLARAKGTSVEGVHSAGVIEAAGGKVRLLQWSEYPEGWNPHTDTRTPIWEACHQLIRALKQDSESAAGALLANMPERGEPIRQLAYHLYTLCERKKWAEEARAYNELIGSWHAIVAASHEAGVRHYGTTQELDF